MKTSADSTITFKRAFGIIIPLCLTALLIAGAIISVANDVYAFVKPDNVITILLEEQHDAKSFSSLLQDRGVINNAFVFAIYLRSHGLEHELANIANELTLNSKMNYRELVDEIF